MIMRKWPTGWVLTHLYMGYFGFTNLWAGRLGRDISGRIWVVHGSDWKLSPLVIYLPTLFFIAIPNQQDESIGLPTHAQWRRLRSTDTDTTHGHNTTQMPANIFVYLKIRTQKCSIKTNMEIWIYFWYNQDRLPFNGCGVGSGEWLGMCFMQPRRGKSWPSSFWMSYQSVTAVVLQRNQIYRRPMHRGMD